MAATIAVVKRTGGSRPGPSRRPEIVLAGIVCLALLAVTVRLGVDVVGRWEASRGPRLAGVGMSAGAAQVRVGDPRVLAVPLNSRGGAVTVESIRLARPTLGLTASFGFAPSTCGQGFTNQAPLARCSIIGPQGVTITPTSTTLIVVSYRLTQPLSVQAPDVVVTYRSGGATHSTALGLDICLSPPGMPACYRR